MYGMTARKLMHRESRVINSGTKTLNIILNISLQYTKL